MVENSPAVEDENFIHNLQAVVNVRKVESKKPVKTKKGTKKVISDDEEPINIFAVKTLIIKPTEIVENLAVVKDIKDVQNVEYMKNIKIN